jgi:hypothetical protein
MNEAADQIQTSKTSLEVKAPDRVDVPQKRKDTSLVLVMWQIIWPDSLAFAETEDKGES